MNETATRSNQGPGNGGLVTPQRNHFFHGKMMDVYHFEMETAYGIGMRRLLNRVVVGRGVICGLDVVRGDDPCSIVVTAGLAIDGWGREIIVPKDTAPIRLPKRLVDKVCRKDDEPCDDDTDQYQQQRDQQSGQSGDDSERDKGDHHDDHDQHDHHDHDDHDHHHDHDRDACLTVTLCYHECETDPVVVLAGDCGTSTPCAPGAIREQYRVGFEPGCTDPVELSCRFPDVLRHREIDHGALARWVTRGCPQPPRNPCIPLANVRLDCRDDGCAIDEIEIEVRPLVFGNGLILDMVSRIVEEMHSNEYGH